MLPLDRLKSQILPMREQIVSHRLYSLIVSPAGLRKFMQHHVFAVWDFMTLLKSLQRALTCVDLPWMPTGNSTSRHLINAIVLAEESDEDGRGGFTSHFEMYHEAMKRAGADTRPIDRMIMLLGQKMPIESALVESQAPPAAAEFVKTTWKFVQSGSMPAIASAFTLGREELIPDLFRSVVSGLAEKSDANLALLDHYLARHIELDEDAHTPMALSMLQAICGDDPYRWDEARSAAEIALRARLKLWDAIAESVLKSA